jgi:hypothetical protein
MDMTGLQQSKFDRTRNAEFNGAERESCRDSLCTDPGKGDAPSPESFSKNRARIKAWCRRLKTIARRAPPSQAALPIIKSAMTNTTMAAAIKIGLNTHHHDHAITPHSFNTMKAIVSKPVNPMPLELELELLISFSPAPSAGSRAGCLVKQPFHPHAESARSDRMPRMPSLVLAILNSTRQTIPQKALNLFHVSDGELRGVVCEKPNQNKRRPLTRVSDLARRSAFSFFIESRLKAVNKLNFDFASQVCVIRHGEICDSEIIRPQLLNDVMAGIPSPLEASALTYIQNRIAIKDGINAANIWQGARIGAGDGRPFFDVGYRGHAAPLRCCQNLFNALDFFGRRLFPFVFNQRKAAALDFGTAREVKLFKPFPRARYFNVEPRLDFLFHAHNSPTEINL